MAKTIADLPQELVKLGLLSAGLVTACRRQEVTRQEIEREARSLSEQRAVIEEIWYQERRRNEIQIRRSKNDLAAANERATRFERMYAAAVDEAKKWRERYQWVDEERRSLESERELAVAVVADSEISLISDIHSCPSCHTPQLSLDAGNLYRCGFCEQRFRLVF
jgi:hypothetical protein